MNRTCSEFDFEPISHQSGIREKDPPVQLWLVFLHATQRLGVLNSTKISRNKR